MKMITISLFIIKLKGNILDMQCDDIFGAICVLCHEQHRQEGLEGLGYQRYSMFLPS